MKTLNLKAEYVVKSDLVKMLIFYLEELQKTDSVYFTMNHKESPRSSLVG